MATKEMFANGASSYLSAALDAVTTSFTVLGGTWPTSGQFTILMDTEYMLVTAVNSLTFTVVRGQEGSIAAAHNKGALLFLDLTAGSLSRLFRQSVSGTNQTARREINFIPVGCTISIADNASTESADITITVPTSSGSGSSSTGYTVPPTTGWTLIQGVGSSGSYTTDSTGVNIIEAGTTSGDNENIKFLYQPIPATPFHIEMVTLFTPAIGNTSTNYGLMLGESSTGKLQAFGTGWSSGFQFNAWTWSNPNTFNTNLKSNNLPLADVKYRRIGYDGTNITFDYSNDDINWVNFYTGSKTAWFTTAPNQIGFYYNGQSGVGPGAARLVHWKQT